MGNFTSRSVDVCARCDEVVVKIGGEILILTSEGTPDLVPVVSSGYPIACDHFQCQKNDTTDGGVSEFQMTLTGDRFGRKFYLCARKDESGRLLLCFDEKPLGSKWILRETSGGEYVVESDSFPGFCLINENSEVSLKQVNVFCRPTNFRVEMFSFQERRTGTLFASTFV